MSGSAVRILDEGWDYLIVLDACRYDYFERLYRDYLQGGVLSKKVSSGTNTPEWLKMNFKKRTDIIYITGNPKITSTKKVDGFEAQ
ncbi:MAG: hypothetical protein JW804_05620, partial [Sedimentisphaerales bacterium]|nr:hypothetical protein [Sedimentisphaerales bacterium]